MFTHRPWLFPISFALFLLLLSCLVTAQGISMSQFGAAFARHHTTTSNDGRVALTR